MTVAEKLKKVKERLTRKSLSEPDTVEEEDKNASDTDVDSTRKSTTSNRPSDEESDVELLPDDGKNFGKRKLKDTGKPATWNILVRVIEAKDVSAGNVRVRAVFDGKSKMTRTVAHAVPKWRQNLLFTIKDQSLETLGGKLLTLKLAHPTTISESTVGEFSCYLSEVIHCEERSVIAKWVALRVAGSDDDPNESACENCGFLKVSISVYQLTESPPQLVDDDGKEQIWNGAHLTDYTLNIQIHSVEQIIRKMINEKKVKKRQTFYVTVECGGQKAETTHEEALLDLEENMANVKFHQMLYLPIQWPTVFSEMTFSMFTKKGRNKTCIGKAVIPLKQIYESGDDGYLPTFGPAYLNLFDCERVTRLFIFNKGEKGLKQNGSRFIGRLFLGIECTETKEDADFTRTHLDYGSIKEAERFQTNVQHYHLFCSMSVLNCITPEFASDAISVLVSVGAYGSTCNDVKFCNSSTFPAQPNWDGCKYFAMPWGNLRPVAEVSGVFEDIEDRFEMSNVLTKVANMIDDCMDEVHRTGNNAIDKQASYVFASLEFIEDMIQSRKKYLSEFQLARKNRLDVNMIKYRQKRLQEIKEMFSREYFAVDYSDDAIEEKLQRMLLQLKTLILELAEDIQHSIPPVNIKVMSFGKLIGSAKIPISEIFQSNRRSSTGEWCGRTRKIAIKWPQLLDPQKEKVCVAVLHAKLWFGRTDQQSEWRNHVLPAEMKYFIEVFEFQNKGLHIKWKNSEGRGLLTNGQEKKIDKPAIMDGWYPIGQWSIMNTRQMWVPQFSAPTVQDKAFEVHRRNTGGKWELLRYTDWYGSELKQKDFDKAAKGWQVSSWKQDKFRNNGDENGWIYTITADFNHANGDREARDHHTFRRRCITRTRRLREYSAEMEDFEAFRASQKDTDWEYARKRNGAYHDGDDGTDRVRRRRYIQEVESVKIDESCPAVRLYEYQFQTTKWQLRCYIMWANDLLPVTKHSARAFVRLSFGTKTKQTLVVHNSLNPIWCETIMFTSVLIAGATRDITKYPPTVVCEVVGELPSDKEVSLGRFETAPNVISSVSGRRAYPRWFPLSFPKNRTRGALLACFEMFNEEDPDKIPLEPGQKHNAHGKRDIPAEFQPQFEKFHVQVLCWGVRNLKKYKLLAVRNPFVDLTIGDQEFRLEPIKDVRKNPNFLEPLIVFSEVTLPSALELSPPFVINLFDARAFNRRPQIGTCIISNLCKYISNDTNKELPDQQEERDKLDAQIREEIDKLSVMNRRLILTKDLQVPLDWWSRYYASMSQFHRAPGYPESGMEYLRVFNSPLEQMNGYNDFADFLDTLPFVKPGKGNFDNPDEKEFSGELKCRMVISRLKDQKHPPEINAVVDYPGPTKCVVRVYIIEANGLISNARKGRVDSYVKLKCGNQKVNLQKNYRSECSDPIFGERVDMTVTIPLEKDLKITVMDKRRILTDVEIGSTTIDLENRLLSKWRATTGLSTQFTVHGEMQWREQRTPLQILQAYCFRMNLSTPIIEKRKLEGGEEKGITVEKCTFWFTDVLKSLEMEEVAMLGIQRQKAGKETEEGSVEVTTEESWDDYDVEMEKEKLKWERQRHSAEKKPPKKREEKPAEKVMEETSEGLVRQRAKKQIMGTQLETIALFILRSMNLVPEHVETRPLYSEKSGSIKKGDLRMFVDIFPLEHGPIPAPFTVTPRKPVNYQLRIAIQDVRGAIPIKRSFAEPVSDLYVKAFVNGMTKGHKTDTHFRVLDGSGEFNWRFLLNFDYNPWEKKVVAYTKTRFFRKPVEELVDPILVIELWDKNKFRTDRLLGDIELDLLDFIEGIGSPADVGVYSSRKRNKRVKCPKCCTSQGCCCKCCVFCFETKCLCGRRKVKKKPFPKPKVFVEPEGYDETVNLFEARNVYGWWPMLTYVYPHDDAQDAKKKNDDVVNPQWIMGLVEMDMMLLTQQEAEQDPVGKKRAEPNHSPYLEKPNRKSWANSWLISRIKPCIKYLWHYYGLQILLWVIIILLICLIIFALIQTWPIIFVEIMKSVF